MIQTYVLNTGELPDRLDYPAQWEAYMQKMPPERVEKIRRIRHEETKKQSFGAGLLLHDVCKRLAPGEEITYAAYGKPACADLPFNLSHTKDVVILSVWEGINREEVMIGCDIEQIQPYQAEIAGRVFTRAEYHSLQAVQNPQEQAELFYRYWTKKESVMKLTGLGLSLPMDLYDVRGSQPVVDFEKTYTWYEKELKKGQIKEGFTQAVETLLYRKMYFKEYRYPPCCITVCSTMEQFAPDYVLAKPGKEGI